MRARPILWLFVLLGFVFQYAPVGFAEKEASSAPAGGPTLPRTNKRKGSSSESLSLERLTGSRLKRTSAENAAKSDPTTGAIGEDIPVKYKRRYQQWKDEFLSTQTGRNQWEAYAQKKSFSLTITVSRENGNGGATGKYKWDDSGNLISATITLGNRIDHGYPNPIYYPVMNSLSSSGGSAVIDENILAATKIAREFGHVNRMLVADGALYRLQNQLISAYNRILLSNGYQTDDPRLVELARRMGGTPIELWEDREYWGEANAMLFLRDRIAKDSSRCALFHRINKSVEQYAQKYAERFIQIAQSLPAPEPCRWE